MKRVELLEALYLQGRLMRELQVYYFSLRKGTGRFPSPEARKVLADSKAAEMEFDRMVRELDEWWDTSAPLSDPREGLELEDNLSFYGDLANGCTGNCGMNYCDENGCVERKKHYVEPIEPMKDEVGGLRHFDKLSASEAQADNRNTLNDGDDDIRI
ncbi:hypothetical protein [Lacihabitans soyangensis]|uniref:Uncharacterized protein n=1 Tax=Lacihabitans soyangensis TaxID=869394 RepID=A0AAE3KTJ5_9BACT|nr:hypothetical protein [Lacihabitans soyangensis]MCP9763824.1 hypothetical protein [Lacihabitans soyangensis]